MASTPEEIVATLRHEHDAAAAFAEVDAWAKGARWDALASLASLSRPARAAGGSAGESVADEAAAAREAVAEHAELALAQADDDGALDVLLGLARRADVAAQRVTASRLGYGQDDARFLATLARRKDDGELRELLACWLQERVLRGGTLANEPMAFAFAEELARSGHPLGALPLHLLPCEREAPSYLPMYGDRAVAAAVASLEGGALSMRTLPPPTAHRTSTLQRIPDAVTEARLAEAVRAWSSVETRVFSATPPLEPSDLGKWLLRALPLDCLAEATRLVAERTTPSSAYGPLFAAASNGGATDRGLQGAYGRRAAFRSLGALVGASENASPETLDAASREAGFVVFRAESSFFHDIAWDLGVLALRPGGASLAVIAASDAD